MLRAVLVDRPLQGLSLLAGANCDTDLKVIMNPEGHFIELQGTAKEASFRRAHLNQMLDLAEVGIMQLIEAHKHAHA